jgi:tRNA A37 threonylcarbamoyladenosine synthetase subunit TsaC/SUA5/YrdC
MIRPGCSCAHIRSQNCSSIESNNVAARDITHRIAPAICQLPPKPRSAEKLDAEFNQRAHYYCDLERKNSGAEQLIVKLQKEYQTLKRETDGKPSMIKRFSLKTIVLGLSLKLSPTRSHQR